MTKTGDRKKQVFMSTHWLHTSTLWLEFNAVRSCFGGQTSPRHFENNTTKYVHPLSPWGELWPLHFVVSWLCCYELGSYVGGLRHPRDLKNVFKFAKPLSFIGIVKRTRFSKLGVRNKACLPVKSRWLPQGTGVLSQACRVERWQSIISS